MKRIISVIKNKYVFTSLSLIIWVLFFDKNDLTTIAKLKKQVKQLQEEKNYYLNEINQINFELNELTSNVKALEKFAREKYLMKRENEDIFVIVEKKD